MLTHEEIVVIRFSDADPAGVVFYPRALELAHAAVEEMIRRSPIGWAGWFASPEYAAPLRHAEADFLRPMRAGNEVTARARVEKLGETSVTFGVEFVDADGEIAARVVTKHVMVSKANGRAVPLSAAIRAALSRGTE